MCQQLKIEHCISFGRWYEASNKAFSPWFSISSYRHEIPVLYDLSLTWADSNPNINQSINWCIQLSTPLIHPHYHPSIHPLTHTDIYPLIHPHNHPSIHPFTHTDIYPFIHQWVLNWASLSSLKFLRGPTISSFDQLCVPLHVQMLDTILGRDRAMWWHNSCPGHSPLPPALPAGPWWQSAASSARQRPPAVGWAAPGGRPGGTSSPDSWRCWPLPDSRTPAVPGCQEKDMMLMDGWM